MSEEESFDTFGSLSRETLYEVVAALLETERDDLAMRFLLHMVDRDPSDGPAWCHLGYIYQTGGDVSKAKEAYLHAADANKNSIDGWVGLCLLRLNDGDRRGARRIYNKRLRGSNAFKRRWYAAGMSYDGIATSMQVELAVLCAAAFKPQNIDVLLRLANINLHIHKDLHTARSIYQRVISKDPESLYAWLGLGDMHMAEYDLDMAMAAFEKATEIAPSDSRPWLKLGIVQHYLDEYDDAEKSYRTALDLTPDDPAIMMNLASTLELMGRTEEADGLRFMSIRLMLSNEIEE